MYIYEYTVRYQQYIPRHQHARALRVPVAFGQNAIQTKLLDDVVDKRQWVRLSTRAHVHINLILSDTCIIM